MIYNLYSLVGNKKVGNKAHNLMLLKRANYNVPNGFVLSVSFCKKIKKDFDAKHKKQIRDYLRQIDYDSPLYPLVVRSSSIFEDSKEKSFAGQFKSVTNVFSEKEMFSAIKKVLDSEAIDIKGYSSKSLKNSLAVIIQKQIVPKKSGVFFTRHPVKNKGFLIEYVNGHLENLVQGKEKPYTLYKVKDLDKIFKKLYLQGKQLEQYFKHPQDIEFAIDKKNKIWFLQTRNITTLGFSKSSTKIKQDKKLTKLKGVTLSDGYAKGKMQYVSDAVDPKEAERLFEKGNILVTHVLFPEYDSIFKKASGIVCYVDSLTSHAAILARENNIPCVGSISITKLLKETTPAEDIIVDGHKSVVYYTPKIKVREKIKQKLWAPKIIKTKEFEKDKKELISLIKNNQYKEVNLKLNEMVTYMQHNFKDFLEHADNKRLKLALSYFRNLNVLLQDELFGILSENHSKQEILSCFAKIDRKEKPVTPLEKIYFALRTQIQNLDKKATIDAKHLWDYDKN